MAKKKVTRIAKLQFMAGQAKPGPELAGIGIDMGGFTKDFNDATRDRMGELVPVVITAYEDRSYEFELKTTPASFLLKKAAKVDKGSARPNAENVGSVTMDQVKEIAEYKMPDLNAGSLEAAMSMVIGTAKSLGLIVEGDDSTIATDEIVEQMSEEEILADTAASGNNSEVAAEEEATEEEASEE
jgi:large subunit ribosomal protein L11